MSLCLVWLDHYDMLIYNNTCVDYIVVLDEATSQIGVQMESKLYSLCRMLGITVISVGHRDSLRQYHNMVLHLDGAGGWTLNNIP